jgi:hypothetical protein
MKTWEIRSALPGDFEAMMRLQGKPMQGPIQVAITREPNLQDRVVVASNAGKLMGMGIRSRESHRWSAGTHIVGSLSGLRSDCAVLPRRIVAEMFRMLRAERRPDEPDWDITAILESNRNARRLLEAGLPGLPRYTPLARLVTFTFAARPRAIPPALVPPSAIPLSALSPSAGLLDAQRPAGRLSDLQPRSLAVECLGNRCRVEIFPGRRTWVAGYARGMGVLRPVLNPCLALAGFPRLPDPGRTVPEAFVVAPELVRTDARSLAAFIAALRLQAGTLGATWVHWGMTAEKAEGFGLLKRARAWKTFSLAYAVHDAGTRPPAVEDFEPEVARL